MTILGHSHSSGQTILSLLPLLLCALKSLRDPPQAQDMISKLSLILAVGQTPPPRTCVRQGSGHPFPDLVLTWQRDTQQIPNSGSAMHLPVALDQP